MASALGDCQPSILAQREFSNRESSGKGLDKQCWLLFSHSCFFLDKMYCYSDFFTVSVKMPKILLFHVTEPKNYVFSVIDRGIPIQTLFKLSCTNMGSCVRVYLFYLFGDTSKT